MKGDAKITIFQHHKDDNLSANNFELDFMLLFHFFFFLGQDFDFFPWVTSLLFLVELGVLAFGHDQRVDGIQNVVLWVSILNDFSAQDVDGPLSGLCFTHKNVLNVVD